MFKSFGWPEAVIILVIVLIIFGAGKLPQIGQAIGKSIREFRKAQAGIEEEDKKTEGKNDTAKESTQSGSEVSRS